MNLLYKFLTVLSFSFISFSAIAAQEEKDPLLNLNWQVGPISESIDGVATLQVPKGYFFLDKSETDKYLELNHNPSSGKDSLFTDSAKWEAYFSFSKTGYVKDDEKIDPDDLLQKYKQGVAIGNDERRKKGWDTLEVDGWFLKPHYDTQKKLLEWAFLLRSSQSNAPVVNYYTRILGRTGVMEVILVSTPDNMNAAIADIKQKFDGFEYNAGEKYSEFKQGDRVAEFGLAALILGGAAAVATKKGFWAVLGGFLAAAWKFIAVLFFALIAKIGAVFDWFKSLFTKKK